MDSQPDAGDELPPRLSARRSAAIRTCRSRSTFRYRRQSLSLLLGRTDCLHGNAFGASLGFMTDKEAVIDALQRLPENASLEEIAEELSIMAGIRRGRADVVGGNTKTHAETEKLLESWATAWNSK